MVRKLLAGAAIVAIVASIALAWLSPDGLEAASWVAAVIGAAATVAAIVGWARRSPALAVSTPEQLDAARQVLADRVLRQWEEEARIRGLFSPDPLSVRWRLSERELMDHARHITANGRLRFNGATDQVGAMVPVLRELRRPRLVVLGEAGTGKTTLALLLLRRLLLDREPGEPVPVMLTLSGWDRQGERFQAWLGRRLAQDYPELRADAFGPTAVKDLVTGGHVLPILDGLDELPVQQRDRVVRALNSLLTDREGFLLTCRTSEFRETVKENGAHVLSAAAVIEPEDLSARKVTAYLAACLPPDPGGSWPELLRRLRDPHDVLHNALDTALMVWLIRAVYIDPGRDPAPLLDAADAEWARLHLLDHVVPAVTAADPAPGPFRSRRAWPAHRVRRWLTLLAASLTERGTRDLAWWDLHDLIERRWIRIGLGLVAGLLAAVSGGAGWWAAGGGPGSALAAGACLGLLVGAGTGMMLWAEIWDIALEDAGELLDDDAPVDPEAGTLRRFVLPGFAAAVGLWAGIGLVGGSGIWLAGLLVTWGTAEASPPELAEGLAMAFSFCLPLFVTALLSMGFVAWVRHTRVPLHPVASTRWQRTLGLTFAGLLAVACATEGWLAERLILAGPDALTRAVAGGAAGGILVAVIAAGHFVFSLLAWPAFAVARALFALSGRLPWQLMAFLADMHRLGLLRQAGRLYQFRHAALQDRLADAP
ncbi:NACHT domain-containing protein [Nonomuraea sp. NPDC049784]|uniref:NACHT domain-containing protein n=1 Tax=Nonomuraea sp. NPDC049784 TaxID=3154361 RepID=UPI0033FBA802